MNEETNNVSIEEREKAWDDYSQQDVEFTASGTFNAGYAYGRSDGYGAGFNAATAQRDEVDGLKPLDVILFCPKCKTQHIDEPDVENCQDCGHHDADHFNAGERNICAGDDCSCDGFVAWLNPPHKSHRCLNCNIVWRPADVPTNGVADTQTKGGNDSWKGEK